MTSHYLIVGGSAAGMAAAHTIRKNDKTGRITVLSNEKHAPYFRPMIPYIITGEKQASAITLKDSGIFTQKDIQVITESFVTSVDTHNKKVQTDSGEKFQYDKILFATGSKPNMPDTVNQLNSKGVFALKSLNDALEISRRALETKHAVMLGGGILNLKTAFALLERQIKVTLVVYSPEVLSQLMDPRDAFLIRKALENSGLDIITQTNATDIISNSHGVCAVALDNGEELPCQMVCVGKGVVPNTEFLESTPIRLDKGISTDIYTACSQDDTYAAGDVAVTEDPATGQKTVTALWTNAVEMGICAGLNMAGIKTQYSGTLGIMNATQIADEPFVAMGTVHTSDKSLEVYIDQSKDMFRKIVFNKEGTELIGALFIGNITNAGLYSHLIREKKPVEKFKQHLISHTLHYGHLLQ